MEIIRRPVSTGLYLLVFLAFLLPFGRISCGDKVLVQATGYEVAHGKAFAVPSGEGGKETRERQRETDYVAIAVLVGAAVGVGLTFLRGRTGAIAHAVYGGHAVLLPLALWGELYYRVHSNSGTLTLLAGYWVTLLLFTLAAVANFTAIPRRPANPGCP
jgi:hypothetical protein